MLQNGKQRAKFDWNRTHHLKNKSQIFCLLKLNLIQESFTGVRSQIYYNHSILAKDLPKTEILFSERSAVFLFKNCLQKGLNGIRSEDLAQNAAKLKKAWNVTMHYEQHREMESNKSETKKGKYFFI